MIGKPEMDKRGMVRGLLGIMGRAQFTVNCWSI